MREALGVKREGQGVKREASCESKGLRFEDSGLRLSPRSWELSPPLRVTHHTSPRLSRATSIASCALGARDATTQKTLHVSRLSQEDGVALLTVLLVMVALAVIGIGSITVTGLENRIAGFTRSGEAATGAAESCLSTGVKIIEETIFAGELPSDYLSNANPAGPVPAANSTTLQQEIMGQSDNNTDAPTGSGAVPNTTVTVNNFTVNGDIDRLYAQPKAGGSLQFAAGYEGTAGGAAGGGVDIMYRIDCVSTNAATNASSRVTAVYACTTTGETCQRKI